MQHTWEGPRPALPLMNGVSLSKSPAYDLPEMHVSGWPPSHQGSLEVQSSATLTSQDL